MVKKLLIVMLLLLMLVIPAACSSEAPAAPEESGEAPAGGEESAAGGEGEAQPTYKEIMVPYDELVPTARIVLLQNAINFSREGFYTADNKPVPEEITYNGETVAAYPISYAADFLINGTSGDLTITNNDGSTQAISAADFAGLYVIIDFTSDAPPVLYNPESGTTITDFLFAVTAEGEAIYSVVSGSIYNAAEIIANVGWDPEASYHYVATDKFHIPVGPAENATGEIRGTLSGAINGSFPDLAIASGKINDVIFIEPMEE